MIPWSKEQYDERDRIMRESDAPLMGSAPGVGYFGSREMLADVSADSYYEVQAMCAKLAKELLDTCPKPKCKECKTLRKQYPYLK